MSAVLVPADESAGVSKDLLGEQDRSSGEGDGRGGTEAYVQVHVNKSAQSVLTCPLTPVVMFAPQINNMKAKFKETLERCDNLERRLGEITKEKQGIEKK